MVRHRLTPVGILLHLSWIISNHHLVRSTDYAITIDILVCECAPLACSAAHLLVRGHLRLSPRSLIDVMEVGARWLPVGILNGVQGPLVAQKLSRIEDVVGAVLLLRVSRLQFAVVERMVVLIL